MSAANTLPDGAFEEYDRTAHRLADFIVRHGQQAFIDPILTDLVQMRREAYVAARDVLFPPEKRRRP